MTSIGRIAFQLGFQISPIILTGGLAQNIPGGMLPIISLTEAANFVVGLLSGGGSIELDNFFAQFIPLPGSTLIDNQIGQYPFANQAVAANAIINQPLRISMRMICPVRGPFGYAVKLITMIGLQRSLEQHNALGGTYTIVTPSFIYTDCVMTGLEDTTAGESKQVQTTWQLNFIKPLVSLNDAQQAYNNLMNKMASGTRVDDLAWSGADNSVGIPSSGIAPNAVPAAQPLTGAGVAGISPPASIPASGIAPTTTYSNF